MNLRRLHVAVPAALAMLAIAPSARGADAPTYGALPTGHLTAVPRGKVPAFIGVREQTAGIFVASQKFSPETPPSQRHVNVIGDAQFAESIRKTGSFNREAEDGACFTEGNRSMRFGEGFRMGEAAEEEQEWDTGQQLMLNLWPKTKENPQAGVAAVHSERVSEQNGNTTLESVDAWVDPSTRGARLIARASMPLALVGSSVGGVKVYAARDDRDGKRLVHFIVTRPSGTATRGGTAVGTRLDGTTSHGSGCGHVRVTLAAEPKSGDSAVVVVPIELPSADAKPKPEKEPNAPKAAGIPARPAEASAKSGKGFGPKRMISRFRQRVPDGVAGETREREARLREMELHLSVSQTSRDREPMVAVSYGWAGRETMQRVFDAPPDGAGTE